MYYDHMSTPSQHSDHPKVPKGLRCSQQDFCGYLLSLAVLPAWPCSYLLFGTPSSYPISSAAAVLHYYALLLL
jgi:hypothetical protein